VSSRKPLYRYDSVFRWSRVHVGVRIVRIFTRPTIEHPTHALRPLLRCERVSGPSVPNVDPVLRSYWTYTAIHQLIYIAIETTQPTTSLPR
jgi:hypothetical protein